MSTNPPCQGSSNRLPRAARKRVEKLAQVEYYCKEAQCPDTLRNLSMGAYYRQLLVCASLRSNPVLKDRHLVILACHMRCTKLTCQVCHNAGSPLRGLAEQASKLYSKAGSCRHGARKKSLIVTAKVSEVLQLNDVAAAKASKTRTGMGKTLGSTRQPMTCYA